MGVVKPRLDIVSFTPLVAAATVPPDKFIIRQFQMSTASRSPTRTLTRLARRDEYEATRAKLLIKEKAHSREGDAIAAERRRLPMIEIPESVTVVSAKGEIPFLDVFEGRGSSATSTCGTTASRTAGASPPFPEPR